MHAMLQTPSLLTAIGPRQREGDPIGIYSICSSNRMVLEAAMSRAAEHGTELLIEATCNQVNQYKGYTGMTPKQFVRYIRNMAEQMHLPADRIIIGGDHLGPYVWRDLPAEKAMGIAEKLVADCVSAGYGKIHLDAGMPLADDEDPNLPMEISAHRAAALCRAAEAARRDSSDHSAPVYVIGAEAPTPGGSLATKDDVPVTDPAEVSEFLKICRHAFEAQGLADAWGRVVAVVVQPGIDFGDRWVAPYNPQVCRALSEFHAQLPDLMTYEIHATDFQSPHALRQMVADHFALLKVGPCLTFAFREAVFGLAHIEALWLSHRREIRPSNIRAILSRVMQADPNYWASHHAGASPTPPWRPAFSYLDRIRYYWNRPVVEKALARLLQNLEGDIPLPLISQYLPEQYRAILDGQLDATPASLIRHKIEIALAPYIAACGMTD